MKPDVESCRPVSQATSSLDAGHDVPCTSGKHEGEARNSSPDPEPVKQKSEPGSGDTKWTEEEFILSVEYFANDYQNWASFTSGSEDTEHKGSSPSEQKGSPSEQKSRPLRASEVLAKEEVEERIVHDWTDNVGSDECSTKLKPSSAPEGSTSAVVIGQSKMPGVEALKADIRVRKESVEKLRGEVKTLTDAIDNNRQKLQDSEESMMRAEETLKKEKSVNNQVRIDRLAMEKKKQELETRLDDGGFDEENPEDMQLLASLEEEEEDLNRKLSGLLSDIGVSTQRQLQLEEQLQSTRANINNLDTVIKEAEAEIEKKVSLFEREKSIIASQEVEVKILDRMAEVPVSVLALRFVPTATEAGVERSSAISCATTKVRAHVLAPNLIDSEGWTDGPFHVGVERFWPCLEGD
ncbi:hypothetical protein R1sor_025338 [Riccia sorocarpa]|uniref:Uncharacterized protein n=1 Tax=Riccia sorocarpa TaxID=122646 RepID=A0ABD3G8C8_9MARC